MTFSKKNTFSTKPFRSGNRAPVKRAAGPPAVLPSPPSRRENIFCFYCAPVPRERVPVKGGRRGRGAKKLSRRSKFRGGAFCPRDASPFPFLPRLEAGRSGLPFLLLRPPPPIRLAGGTRADGGGGGTHRNANLYYPREREREIVASRRS